jgi:tetratricopeptide (TPR) repeat protein
MATFRFAKQAFVFAGLALLSSLMGCTPVGRDAAIGLTAWGRLLIAQERYNLAEFCLAEAVRADSTYPDSWYTLGLLFSDLDALHGADSCFSSALQLKPIHYGALLMRGSTRYRMGLYFEAIADFSDLITMYPDRSAGYDGRALVNEELGFDRLALQDLSMAIERAWLKGQLYHRRGLVFLTLGRHAEAIADFTMAIASEPDFADAFADRASARYERGEFAMAIADCDSALRIDPEHLSACYNKGLSADRLGDREQAVEAYKQFLDIAPEEDPAIPEVQRRIRELEE